MIVRRCARKRVFAFKSNINLDVFQPGRGSLDESSDHAKLAEELPLDQIDLSDPALYQEDVWRPYFLRLRRDAPCIIAGKVRSDLSGR